MVAQLPLSLALHDVLLSAGLGFLLALFYRALRVAVGSSKLACFVSDVAVFVLAAVLYRGACASVFAAGIARWYSLLALAGGYALCTRLIYAPVHAVETAVRWALRWPFVWIWRNAFLPLHAKHLANKKARREKKHSKKAKTDKQGLQKPVNVLYNSK